MFGIRTGNGLGLPVKTRRESNGLRGCGESNQVHSRDKKEAGDVVVPGTIEW